MVPTPATAPKQVDRRSLLGQNPRETSALVTTSTTDPDALARIHAEIGECHVCSRFPGVKKPAPLARGVPVASLLVVGEAPGNTEVSSGKAFSGRGGRTLFEWLSKCDIDQPREVVYLTAAVKCVPGDRSQLPHMADTCRRFLHRQLVAIQPSLVITLGAFPYSELAFDRRSFAEAICQPRDSREVFLLPPHGFHFVLLPWPHPSGRSMWLNDLEHRKMLASTFAFVRGLLGRRASP